MKLKRNTSSHPYGTKEHSECLAELGSSEVVSADSMQPYRLPHASDLPIMSWFIAHGELGEGLQRQLMFSLVFNSVITLRTWMMAISAVEIRWLSLSTIAKVLGSGVTVENVTE